VHDRVDHLIMLGSEWPPKDMGEIDPQEFSRICQARGPARGVCDLWRRADLSIGRSLLRHDRRLATAFICHADRLRGMDMCVKAYLGSMPGGKKSNARRLPPPGAKIKPRMLSNKEILNCESQYEAVWQSARQK
jgi:hypothetical protein